MVDRLVDIDREWNRADTELNPSTGRKSRHRIKPQYWKEEKGME